MLLATPQDGLATELWPHSTVTSMLPPGGPWDHPTGAVFTVTSRSFLFHNRKALDKFELNAIRSAEARQIAVKDLIQHKEITVVSPGRTILALGPIILGRGLVRDKDYGDGYLVMDYLSEAFTRPVTMGISAEHTSAEVLESPWDHPNGSLFLLPSRSFLLRNRQSLNRIAQSELESTEARQAVISDLIQHKEITILSPGHVVLALDAITFGRGFVHDQEHGDGYLVVDYDPWTFIRPVNCLAKR